MYNYQSMIKGGVEAPRPNPEHFKKQVDIIHRYGLITSWKSAANVISAGIAFFQEYPTTKIEPGELLYSEGRDVGSIDLMFKGVVFRYRRDKNKSRYDGHIEDSVTLAGTELLQGRERYDYTAQALTACYVNRAPLAKLQYEIERNGSLSAFVTSLDLLAKDRSNRKNSDQKSQNTSQRIADVILGLSQNGVPTNRVTQEMIGAIVGCDRVNVNKAIMRMQAAGIIEWATGGPGARERFRVLAGEKEVLAQVVSGDIKL